MSDTPDAKTNRLMYLPRIEVDQRRGYAGRSMFLPRIEVDQQRGYG